MDRASNGAQPRRVLASVDNGEGSLFREGGKPSQPRSVIRRVRVAARTWRVQAGPCAPARRCRPTAPAHLTPSRPSSNSRHALPSRVGEPFHAVCEPPASVQDTGRALASGRRGCRAREIARWPDRYEVGARGCLAVASSSRRRAGEQPGGVSVSVSVSVSVPRSPAERDEVVVADRRGSAAVEVVGTARLRSLEPAMEDNDAIIVAFACSKGPGRELALEDAEDDSLPYLFACPGSSAPSARVSPGS